MKYPKFYDIHIQDLRTFRFEIEKRSEFMDFIASWAVSVNFVTLTPNVILTHEKS